MARPGISPRRRLLRPLAAALAWLVLQGVAGVAAAQAPIPAAEADARPPAEADARPPDEARPSAFAPLPPVEPDPAVAPIIDGKDAAPASTPAPVPPAQRPEAVIKTILGLLALVALAYLAAHPVVQRWERGLGISQVITAGFPFVVLGMIARRPEVGILSDGILAELSPVLRIGLGWIGFVVGFRFDARTLGTLPPGGARLVALGTLLPFAFVLAASGAVLLLLTGDPGPGLLRNPVFVRDALILGTAAAMTATPPQRLAPSASESALSRIVRGEELAGIVGLALVAALFRPHEGVTWQLPGVAWVLLTLGLGGAVGLITWTIFQRPHGDREFVVLTLGSVAFAAGLAGYLRLSSLVVAFIAGVLLANFPGAYKERLGATLRRLERPIYLLSLTVIGALWDVGDWRGWLLVPVFAAARLAGKWVAVESVSRRSDVALGGPERRALAVSPMGPLAIAIVVNAQLLYPGGSISLIVSSVLGGAIVTEVLVQLWSRRRGGAAELAGARVGSPEAPRARSGGGDR